MPGKDLIPRPAVPPPATIEQPPWQQKKQMQGESAFRTIARWARRDRHYTVPLAVPFVLMAAALILHAFHATGFVFVIGIIVTGLIAFFAPHKWTEQRQGEKRPNWHEVIYADASAAAASLWLWVATWLGPKSGFITFLALASILSAGTVTWGYFWWMRKRPRGKRRRDKRIARWDAWWQSHCWGWNLGGSRVADVWEMGVTTKLLIQGMPGKHSIQHVNQVMHLIESGADGHADIGMIRAEAVKNKPSQFFLYLKKENPLREIVQYDMGMAPQSVHDPMPEGLTETSSWMMTTLRKNCFVNGESRSGKSNRALVRIAALSGCRDGRTVVIDLKGGRSARPVLKARAAEYVITEVDEARLYLLMLEAEIKARSKYAYTEEEQLLATEEVPSVHTFIDETNGLTSVANGDAQCAAKLGIVASQGMGLEVYVEVYTQYGSLEESVRTEQTRMNLLMRICYRVAEARHGAYCIPEYSKLDASKLEEKGTCYVKDGPEARAEQVRTPKMDHKLFTRIASQNAATIGHRPPLMLYCGNQQVPGRDMTWQQWWDSRWSRLDEAFHGDSPQYAEWAATQTAASPAEAFRAAEQAHADIIATIDPIAASVPGEGDAASAAARIEAEIASGAPADYRPPLKPVNLRPVITAQKDRFAQALTSPPAGGISPKLLMDESGMSSSWTHSMLGKLCERGTVVKIGRGRYIGADGADVAANIAAVEAVNDQLHREAVETINAA